MAQTVIGLFENESAAREAAEKLESAGIGLSNVDVSRGSGHAQTGGNDKENESGIARFFKNLFGDSDDTDRYTRLGSSG